MMEITQEAQLGNMSRKSKNGVYKEDYNTGSGIGITNSGAGAINGADLKRKFHFQIS